MKNLVAAVLVAGAVTSTALPAYAEPTPLRVLYDGPQEVVRRTMHLEHDDMKEITWHRVAAFACEDDACPGAYNKSSLQFYFGSLKGRRLPLRLVARLEASAWVFATTIIVKADGKLHKVAVPHTKWERDTRAGDGIVEYVDLALAEVNPALVTALCSAKDVKVRFDGKGEATYELEAWQVEALRITCHAWSKWTPAREKAALQSQMKMAEDAVQAAQVAQAARLAAAAQAEAVDQAEAVAAAARRDSLKVDVQEKANAFWACLDTSEHNCDEARSQFLVMCEQIYSDCSLSLFPLTGGHQ